MSTISNLLYPRADLTNASHGQLMSEATSTSTDRATYEAADAATALTTHVATSLANHPAIDRADRVDHLDHLDHLDAQIWAAARATDDPQLAVGKAREFAEGVFVGLVIGAGSGSHSLNCSVPTDAAPVTAEKDLHFEVAADIPAVSLPASGAERELCELFALAHVSGAEATAILRSRPLPGGGAPGTTFDTDGDIGGDADGYVVRGWRLADGQSTPIDAAGMFAFCCSEASSGEPLPLDPNTRYADARALITTPHPR